MQKRRNSSSLAMELCPFRIKPSTMFIYTQNDYEHKYKYETLVMSQIHKYLWHGYIITSKISVYGIIYPCPIYPFVTYKYMTS